MTFCETCVHLGEGRALSDAEALIHADKNPGHKLINVNTEENETDQ